MPREHVVSIRPRTAAMVAGLVLAVLAAVKVVLMSERVLVWMFVSLLLALALNPRSTRCSAAGPSDAARPRRSSAARSRSCSRIGTQP